MLRISGETIALSPPLIISRDQIDEILLEAPAGRARRGPLRSVGPQLVRTGISTRSSRSHGPCGSAA